MFVLLDMLAGDFSFVSALAGLLAGVLIVWSILGNMRGGE